MLNIEVIKFEAQDVITTSVAAPTEAPVVPEVTEAPWDGVHTPICNSGLYYEKGDSHHVRNGVIQIWSNNTGWVDCDCGCHK